MGKGPVLQEWVCDRLTWMQQSVLITATRGPDGIKKDHPAKVLLRWFRRSYLISALDGKVFKTPYETGGGSFTGPLENKNIDDYIDTYLRHIDELPHHFQLHLMHAAEILGYKHPDSEIREWWMQFYLAIVKDAHLNPETEEALDYRLGDSLEQWETTEIVKAK